MARSGLIWVRPPSHLARNVDALGERYYAALAAVGDLVAAELEADAKASASWQDRTTQARAGLTGLAHMAARDALTVYLYHRAEHGKWLEIARGGPLRVIMPTLERNVGRIFALIKQVLG